MIELLEPVFQGDWREYGETLVHSPLPPRHAFQVQNLLDDLQLLKSLVSKTAERRKTGDLRAAASAWSCDYLDVLLPPIVAAATLLQHVFPCDTREMWLELDAHGTPHRFHIPHLGTSHQGYTPFSRYATLIHDHLGPLFSQLHRCTKVPTKILWGNAARALENLFREAHESLSDETVAPLVLNDRQLLEQKHWDNGRINPLYMPQRLAVQMDGGREQTIALHRQCCLYYLFPDEGYCNACPLDPKHVASVM